MFNIFGNNTAPQAQPAPQAPVAAPAAPAPTVPNQGNIPPAVVDPTVVPVVEPVPDTPLAPFESLWQTVPKTEGDTTPTLSAPLTAAEITKAAQGANFTSGVTPEQLAAVVAGGDGASEALMGLLNQVGRQVMVQQTLVNNELTSKNIAEHLAVQSHGIPDLVRTHATQAHMATENPIFNNPAIKPVVEATRTQLQAKFPNAAPAEIAQMTKDYITSMGEAFAPKPDPNALPTGETDWSNF